MLYQVRNTIYVKLLCTYFQLAFGGVSTIFQIFHTCHVRRPYAYTLYLLFIANLSISRENIDL